MSLLQEEAQVDGPAAVVRLSGDLDLATGPTAAAKMRSALVRRTDVVVDLRGLSFMDVAGLRVVLDAAAHARRLGRRLMVVRGGVQVDMVFTLTGAGSTIDFVSPDRADGLRAIAQR